MRERNDILVGLMVAFIVLFPLGYLIHISPRFPGSLAGGITGMVAAARSMAENKKEDWKPFWAMYLPIMREKTKPPSPLAAMIRPRIVPCFSWNQLCTMIEMEVMEENAKAHPRITPPA